MSSQTYQLSSHVRGCTVGQQVVLLDLKRGKYLGIPARQVARLAPRVGGLPVTVHGPIADAPSERLLESLRSKGLVTDMTCARQAPARIDEALESMHAADDMPDVRLDARRVWFMACSAGRASLALRCRSMMWIVQQLSDRHQRLAARVQAHAAPEAPIQLRDCVAAYERLRPLLFTSRDQCLFDSLALLNFLALEGLCAHWVIGVKVQPFGAHSWLQHGSTVLNDQHDRVRRFTPILVV